MNNRDDGTLVWLPIGLLVGSSATVLIGFIQGEHSFPPWVKNYDSMIGALATVAIGFFSLLFLWKQIRQTQVYREDDLARKQQVARAMLSYGLEKILQTSELIITQLIKQLPPDDIGNTRLNPSQMKFVSDFRDPPFSAIEIVTRVIETAPSSIAENLRELLIRIQYYHARLLVLTPQEDQWTVPGVSIWSVRQCICDFIDLHVRVSRCFPYARNQEERIRSDPISGQEITNAMFLVKLGEGGDTWEMITKRVRDSHHG